MAETAKKTGGSAFPQACHDAYGMGPGKIDDTAVFDVQGMTLRDWFAGRALSGLLSDGETIGMMGKAASEAGKSRVPYMASAAYEIADAMLEARSK